MPLSRRIFRRLAISAEGGLRLIQNHSWIREIKRNVDFFSYIPLLQPKLWYRLQYRFYRQQCRQPKSYQWDQKKDGVASDICWGQASFSSVPFRSESWMWEIKSNFDFHFYFIIHNYRQNCGTDCYTDFTDSADNQIVISEIRENIDIVKLEWWPPTVWADLNSSSLFSALFTSSCLLTKLKKGFKKTK